MFRDTNRMPRRQLHRWMSVAIVSLGLASCTRSSPMPTQLLLRLPEGFSVSIDDAPTPISIQGTPSVEVSAGKHSLQITTLCGAYETSVEVPAHQSVEVSADAFSGLALATLQISPRAPEGVDLRPTVTLTRLSEPWTEQASWPAPASVFTSGALVPACALRMFVRSGRADLGGLIEDIPFEPGQRVSRTVVFAAGPDMVRIHGGPFRMGPPGPDLYDPNFHGVGPGEDFEEWPWLRQYDAVVGDFEIDRHEVTTAQFHACREAGGCPYEQELHLWGQHPEPEHLRWCTTDIWDRSRTPRSGQEEHPMNCVGPWEAKQYCAWVGKRLPTDLEWEYAARSRKSEYACGWGGDHKHKIGCNRSAFRSDETQPVCSVPGDDTEQGLCDMGASVQEFVTDTKVPGRPEQSCTGEILCRGDHWYGSYMPFEASFCCAKWQSIHVGFRCARDIPQSGVQ